MPTILLPGLLNGVDPLLMPLAAASAACYLPGAVPTFENELRLCHCFHSVVGNINTFAFEGTTSIQEWIVDFMAVQVPILSHPRLGMLHSGFAENILPIVDDIADCLTSLGRPPFYLTGHSKGAGEAIIAHAMLKDRGFYPLATRVFEPPLVGGHALSVFLSSDDVVWTQTANGEGPDIVTLVPGGPFWEHSGRVQRLPVPDNFDIATKHKMPGVIAGLMTLQGAALQAAAMGA